MRRYMTLALTAGACLALAATLASGSSFQNARAEEGCEPHSLHGGYGFAFQGQVFLPSGAELDIAGAGRVVFDGHGGLSGREWASTNGGPSSLTFTGSYTVQPDCSGTVTIVNDNGRTDHGKIALVENGQEVNLIVTDPGVVLTVQLSRQAISECTARSLSGVFNFAATGSAFAPTGAEVGDVAVMGRIQFDGHGNEVGSTTGSFNGAPFSQTFTGTDQVNADCTGSATDNLSTGSTDHVNFVLVEQGNEIKAILANPGSVFTATLDRMSGEEH